MPWHRSKRCIDIGAASRGKMHPARNTLASHYIIFSNIHNFFRNLNIRNLHGEHHLQLYASSKLLNGDNIDGHIFLRLALLHRLMVRFVIKLREDQFFVKMWRLRICQMNCLIYLNNAIIFGYHGTCWMGPFSDPVLSHKLISLIVACQNGKVGVLGHPKIFRRLNYQPPNISLAQMMIVYHLFPKACIESGKYIFLWLKE